MGILLGFLPFLAFAILSVWRGALVALIAGAAVSGGLLIRNRLGGGSLKILEAGAFILFVALAIYVASVGQPLSIIAVRLCVDIGLLGVVVASMLAGLPFTLQYAKEQVPPQYWTHERFIRTNYLITAGWAVAFLVMVIAEAAMLVFPAVPKSVGTIAIAAALLGAVWFTKNRSQAARAAA